MATTTLRNFSDVGMPSHLNVDTWVLAEACNDDCRFQEAGWAETPASIEQLLLSQGFYTSLHKLMPAGARLIVGALVASIYGCRVTERGMPRKGGASRRTVPA